MKQIQTKEEFKELLVNNKYVVLDFFATWCNPCKMLSPVMEQVESENPDVAFAKVDVDQAEELAALFGIQSIPLVAYIKDKTLVLRELGFKPKNNIQKNIDDLKK